MVKLICSLARLQYIGVEKEFCSVHLVPALVGYLSAVEDARPANKRLVSSIPNFKVRISISILQ